MEGHVSSKCIDTHESPEHDFQVPPFKVKFLAARKIRWVWTNYLKSRASFKI